MTSVEQEILDIMETYRIQEAQGYLGTPGGLEHMGDVWTLLSRWDLEIRTRVKYFTALNKKVTEWHDSDDVAPPIHEFLGLTHQEYGAFVQGQDQLWTLVKNRVMKENPDA